MSLKILLNLTVLLALVYRSTETKIYVPSVKGSYRAIGEIIIHGAGKQKLMTFEENFDKTTQVTSFWSIFEGTNTTILENLNGGDVQGLQYNLTDRTCKRLNPTDWGNSELDMRLRPTQEVNGNLIFPIREFLSLTVSDLGKNDWEQDKITFRGVLAIKYVFAVQSGRDNLEVEAYWADPRGGSTMSSVKEVPLGFIVSRVISEEDRETLHIINLFYFAQDVVNDQMLQPIRGIYCPDRTDAATFPELNGYDNLAWSVEFTWAEKELTTSIDAWVDMQSKLLRMDFQPLETLSGVEAKAESIIVSFDEQAVFHMFQGGKQECQVTHLDKESYYPQMILDPRNQANWIPEVFFGTKNNKYFRIGQAVTNGVPCDVYQAERKDWPPGESQVTSVWEWCFVNKLNTEEKLPKAQLPLVSLNIYVTESPYEFDQKAKPYKGQEISYHFYNVQKMDPHRMEAIAFKISPCFKQNRQLKVSFQVDLVPSDIKFIMEIENDVYLNSMWSQAAYVGSQLSPSSLRIEGTKTSFLKAEGPLLVQLTILDQHPDLPHRVENLGIDVVKNNLKAAIDKRDLGILYSNNKNSIALSARPGSFKEESNQEEMLFSFPPALMRTKAYIEEHNANQEAKESIKRKVPWLVGVFCLQVGVAVGVISVALKKRKLRDDQVRLVNEQTTASDDTQVTVVESGETRNE